MSRSGRRLSAVAVALCVSTGAAAPAKAGDSFILLDDEWQRDPKRHRALFFTGTDITRDSLFGWSGIVAAPQGLLLEDGWRLRVMGGAGRYRYRTDAVAGGLNLVDVMSLEAMLGYRFALGDWIASMYVGAHVESQNLHAPDPAHATQGVGLGIKGALEFYRRFTPDIFATIHGSASTVHGRYHARTTLVREFPPAAIGIEAALLGDDRYSEPRAGLFLRATYHRVTFSIAGGFLSNSDKGGGAYGTLALTAGY